MKLMSQEKVEIFYKTYGDDSDTPVILIHGLGADYLMWKPQIEVYPSKGFYLVVPDLGGHGRSSAVDSFSIKDCATDIAILLDELALENAIIIGMSLGGLVAQQFAYDYPQKVKKLIICDSFCNTNTLFRKFNGWLQWLSLKISPNIISKTLHLAYKGKEKEMALNYLKESIRKMNIEQVIQEREAINRIDFRDNISKIKSPTLVLVGSDFGKFAIKMAKEIANHIHQLKFNVIEGGCDPSNLTATNKFNLMVLEFIKEK